MANLIIKPTSGGSLILQDEGGDASLTVGTTGSTTLAGTANNLGTATAGTLSSGVTFPGAGGTKTAGHPVGMKWHYSATQYDIDGVGSTVCTNWNMTYTPLSATNRLVITQTFLMKVQDENTVGNHEAQGSAWMYDVTNSAALMCSGYLLAYESGATTAQMHRAMQHGTFSHVPTLSSGSITYSVKLGGAGNETPTYVDQIAAHRTTAMHFHGTITEYQV